ALAGYLAWGTIQSPLVGTVVEERKFGFLTVEKIKVLKDPLANLRSIRSLDKKDGPEELEATGELAAALASESERRSLIYAGLAATGLMPAPMNVAVTFPYLTLDFIPFMVELEKSGK